MSDYMKDWLERTVLAPTEDIEPHNVSGPLKLVAIEPSPEYVNDTPTGNQRRDAAGRAL